MLTARYSSKDRKFVTVPKTSFRRHVFLIYGEEEFMTSEIRMFPNKEIDDLFRGCGFRVYFSRTGADHVRRRPKEKDTQG